MPKVGWKDHQQWLEHPATREFRSRIEERIRETRENLSNGTMLRMDSPEQTAMQCARQVGFSEGLSEALNITLMDEEDDDGKD